MIFFKIGAEWDFYDLGVQCESVLNCALTAKCLT